LKNTLGSIKDELFADDDDWDDWNRPASDPWSRQGDWSRASGWSSRDAAYPESKDGSSRYPEPSYSDRYRPDDRGDWDDRFPESAEPAAPRRMPRRSPDLIPPEDDPWAER
jgi:molecular chaperone DnaK